MNKKLLLSLIPLSTALGLNDPVVYSLLQRVSGADIIVVASLLRSGPAPAGVDFGAPRNALPIPVYRCATDLRVEYVIKGTLDPKADRLTVFSYFRTADCRVTLMGRPVPDNHSLIWLLRANGRVLRTWTDNYDSLIWLTSFPPAARTALSRFNNDPRLGVGYLLLAPNVGSPAGIYGEDMIWIAPHVTEMVGYLSYWELLAKLYVESPVPQKPLICLLAAVSGACVGCARAAAARGLPEGRGADEAHSLLRPDQFRLFESRMLRDMSDSSMARSRRSAAEWELFKDELFRCACTSSRSLRSRARELLRTQFSVDPRKITCIPCGD